MKIYFIIGISAVFLAACKVMPPFQPVDFATTPEGKKIMRDTPRTWDYMRIFLDGAIKDELNGLRPSGGASNWNVFWLNSIKVWRDGGQENPEKYVAHIVQRRREIHLPEIVFPPSP